MNILIPHSWLTEFLETNAPPKKIAESLSLSGPSVEKIEKAGDDWVYDIEVTTNRVDVMSIYGVAREAAVILPQFGYIAKLKPYIPVKTEGRHELDIKIVNDPKLCRRILAIKLENVKLGPSPQWLSSKLRKVGQRPLNNAIDITNYVMWEIGHPIHVFDYDSLGNKKIVVREAKKGETLITLDKKRYRLEGGEVVFDDGTGEIIDLPGIMGTANTIVTRKTRNVLVWIESINPGRIRSASMGLAIRSQAAILNEKRVDPELGLPAISRAIELYQKVTQAHLASRLVDIYPNPYKIKKIKTTKAFIDNRLGINTSKVKIKKILDELEFTASWKGNHLELEVPSFRTHDISIPEDIIEEVARIYGYHNLPSELMQGSIPNPLKDAPFAFEMKIRNILKGWGSTEVYTYSLVPKEYVEKNALKIKNPLGAESEYMRTTLSSSLIAAAKQNSGETEPFHLFEMANVYMPRGGDLPKENMTLAGIFANYEYREAKGIVESLLEELNIKASFIQKDSKDFLPNQRIEIKRNGLVLGQFGTFESGYIYYEFSTEQLKTSSSPVSTFKPIPKYPAQIEDITLVLPERTRVGNLIQSIKSVSKLINNVELTDTYRDSYTFRIWYQHPRKTLTDKEVEKIRKIILKEIKKKFGAAVN